jgi:hypothetical protein
MEGVLIMQEQAFAPLTLRRHRVIDSDKSRYRVFRSSGEFITVEAKTAFEAFKSSGFREARRIVRLTRYVSPYLDRSELTEAAVSPSPSFPAAVEPTVRSQHIQAPADKGAPAINAAVEQIHEMALDPMQPTISSKSEDGIEEMVPASTPVPFKAPKRLLASEAPGAAPSAKKPERTMLSVQDIDKLLGK